MANSPQARKRARQAEKRRQHNAAMRSSMRTAVKKVLYAIRDNNQEAANLAYKAMVPVIDSMSRKGHMHKNKAARHKSRLNTRIRAMSAA